MPTPKQRCKDIRDRFYPEDDRPAEVFFRRAMALGRPDVDLVEVGCGRTGGFLQRLAPHFRRVYGFDPEVPSVSQEGNIQLSPGFAEHLDLPDASVDVVISIDVVEHLDDPKTSFSEFLRVLRPGGRILLITPNKMHPPLLAARLLSHRTRQVVNGWTTGTHADDTFRTFYRLNSAAAFKALARALAMKVISVDYVSNHPEYLMFSRLSYRIGVSLERAMLSKPSFAFLRQLIFADLQKPGGAGA